MAAMAAMLGATSVCRGVGGSAALASSFAGEKVRVSAAGASAFPGRSVHVVAEALRDGVGASAPWPAQRASLVATELSAVATEFAPTSLFGLTERLESEEYEEDDEQEILRVDNESVDDEDELAVANLGIPKAVVDALASRGIEKLFPIQVRPHSIY